ncbi:methylenetetrahydrofolate--tRNA-(uracil(54)-C(5))-methyltransferase (FADH(2)-oxidizing) TrmFO [Thermanaerothrix sp. 4228-RoL]|uniref:Methylenetetrahydrofolate--tRNA-(uracil-5-)-methyltransferase TrmFO n=1 Tax=Thermanaerothrix solaris TaxID=3058434 RepID=A0ABU3NJT7_9CHLR|nr:methylenetetrahydrofolate--tRNA-(uracil(54)-C(5))-methyltransferase (FADH(2)-oxidizing) TrmFO [Thermanaerothrix sp. 4228-RoL]MDT8897119.1 methylenetetrahydrofolate--tRNA-(uracil(54)-C(5))-methyltransferase (FADH(2)-oxidizing) TrmFO [Thermanaerothrix sp. 4228-RoL]
MSVIHVIGGGLAGSEAAWQAAELGAEVILYEMRPLTTTGAHRTDKLAELICSNSLGSRLLDRASGLLKEELRLLRSLLLECAEATAVPAGAALAVDRDAFAELVTRILSQHPRIRIVRQEVTQIPEGVVIIASGPLTSPALSVEIQRLTGENYLFFYDAISPIVTAESINMNIAFRASRYGRGLQDEGDYINCPMNKAKYKAFVDALVHAERIPLREFERAIEHGVKAGADKFFEGCLPIEVLATRGEKALAFGPLRPVGLIDPRTGKQPYAVVQLRQDNLMGTLYSLVGFQTNLTYPEQKRVFHMIPGLENAEFVRYGQMHRNTYIASPRLLLPTLQLRHRKNILFAGQITGVEGYMGNIATGLLAGWNAVRILRGEEPVALPLTTMLGALCRYITEARLEDFQPMKANFGLLPELSDSPHGKQEKHQRLAMRALEDLNTWLRRYPERQQVKLPKLQ